MTRITMVGLALALAVAVTACGRGGTADAAPGEVLAPSYSFRVEIDGAMSPDPWTSVDGMGFAIGSTTAPDPTAGGRTSSPTGADPITLRFTLAFEGGRLPAIKDWVKEVYDGADVRKTISIQLTGPDGSTVRTFNFFECFPTSFALDGPDSESGAVLRWTLEVRVNRIEMA